MFPEWLTYNAQVDQVFLAIAIVVVVLLVSGWLILKSSVKAFKVAVKGGVLAFLLIQVLLWAKDYFPW